MIRKESKRWGWVIVVFLALILTICYYINDAPHRWSRDLQTAIQSEDNQVAMQLIDEGIRKGYSLDTLSEQESDLWTILEAVPQTPLQSACNEGNYLVAERLLREGASVRPEDGGAAREPLFCVLLRPYTSDDAQLVQLLIDYGAALSYGDYHLILEAASRSPMSPTSNSALDDLKSDVVQYDEEIAKGITEVFLILAKYSDCYVVDSSGRNALHYAAIYENWYLLETLVAEFDYQLDAEDNCGNTAYILAEKNGAPQNILELLPKDKSLIIPTDT